MKICFITCFLLFINLAFSQKEKQLIDEIDSINSAGISYYDTDRIVLSFKAFNKAKKISDSINESYGQAISNFYLGNIFNLMQQYGNAERSYKLMLDPSIDIRDNFLIANAYLSLGKLNKKEINKANSYFEKALSYASKHDYFANSNYTKDQHYELILKIRIELCEFYLNNSSLDKALDKAYINLLRLEESIKSTDNVKYYYKGYYSYVYGKYQAKKELYNNANERFNEAIGYLTNNNPKTDETNLLLSKIYKDLSLSHEKVDNKEEAYAALLKFNEYNGEFLNREKIRQSSLAKSKFNLEVYENNAQIANSEKQRQSEKTRQLKIVTIIMATSLVLLAISLITLLKNYITKRKLTDTLKSQNEELELAKNEALKSSELKSKFISNVTHELRTPLYGVVGITSLLLTNNNLNSKDSKFLQSLKYSGDYLLNLVNEVLQFGKIESEDIEVKKVSVNIRQLLENIIGSFDYKLQETNNEIKLHIDKQVPKTIECDNVRLSQVLINLIGNAVKFTKKGCIDIYVKILNILDDTVDLRFEIKDNGLGIPKEKFDLIFENFSQLENSNLNYQGTGLGLSISKKIIELFGSKIELESEFGKGSKFSFNVTFNYEASARSCATKVKILEDKVRNLNKHRILIAEDNKINQIVTKNLLEKQNYECVVVENGAEALKVLKDQTFNLILMDINMPVMGGIEATQLIRKFNAEMPIIALTAADVEELKENHDDIGFDGIITKPFDNYEFFQIIETTIQNNINFKGKVRKLY